MAQAAERHAGITERPQTRAVPVWQWPTVLSLDAPLVAVTWQWAVAKSAGTPLGATHAAVLAAVVWSAYALDRWLESFRVPEARLATERHRFYRRHRRGMALFGVAVFIVTSALAVVGLTPRDWAGGLVLLGATLLYLLSHQGVHRYYRFRVPKEFCVASLLTAGTALFSLTARPGALADLTPTALWFFLLAFANCALISIWERTVDASQGQESLARSYPGSVPWLRALPWSIALAALLAALGGSGGTFAGSAALSAALLGVLDRTRPRLGASLARVLADAALLTPLLLALSTPPVS